MDLEKYLHETYFNPDRPGSYGGVDKLYRAAKLNTNFTVTKGLIKKWLEKQSLYTKHRSVRRKFKRQRVIVPNKHYQFDCDTVNMTGYQKANKFKYILIVIDILTRFVWSAPLHSLKAVEMVEALKSVLITPPRVLRSDSGSEFKNKYIEKYLEENNINHVITLNEVKANFAERVIRTIKSKLTKIMAGNNNEKWVESLPLVTHAYNNTYHRSIKMTPAEAMKTDDPVLFKTQYDPKPVKRRMAKKPTRGGTRYKFKTGVQVRINYLRSAFEREYYSRWTDEVFFVTGRVIKQGFDIYTLKDWDGHPIKGTFYRWELQKVSVQRHDDTLYQIERVIKTRRRGGSKEVLVKWRGWAKKFNSWVKQSEVTDI